MSTIYRILKSFSTADHASYANASRTERPTSPLGKPLKTKAEVNLNLSKYTVKFIFKKKNTYISDFIFQINFVF